MDVGRVQMVSLAAGCIVAVAGAYTALGFPILATRDYVARQLEPLLIAAEADRKVLKDTRVDILESRRNAVDRDVFDQSQRIKAIGHSDPDVEWRLHEKQKELQDLDVQIEDLRRGH